MGSHVPVMCAVTKDAVESWSHATLVLTQRLAMRQDLLCGYKERLECLLAICPAATRMQMWILSQAWVPTGSIVEE